MSSSSRTRITTFPKSMVVKCPRCGGRATAICQGSIFLAKYLLPCQHSITPDQETAIVKDHLKRGL